MPTKRKRIDRPRLDTLSAAQRSHLLSGCYCLPWGDEFEDEAHRRAAWRIHRDALLEHYDRPGHRPAAFWDYEVRGGWRRHGASEPAAVHRLLLAGKLKPCVENEVEAIERLWLHEVRVSLVHAGYRLLHPEQPLRPYGTPSWFYERHAPAILGRLQRELKA